MWVFRSALLVAAYVLTWQDAFAQSRQVCPMPRVGIQRGQPNGNAELVNFSFRSQSYPVELYSAFAPQPNALANFCLRYEIENQSTSPLEKFSWPLATMEMDTVPPKKRQSLLVTKSSNRQPWLDKTKLSAFLREEVSSQAFQVERQKAKEARTDLRLMPEMQVRGAQWFDEQIPSFKEPTELPVLSAAFSDGDAEVNAATFANWDGKRITIQIRISRSSDKTVRGIIAPLALAFYSSRSPENVTAMIASANRALPLDGNSFWTTVTLEKNASLFVVEHPIIFSGANGRVCFLASSYSPVPIEPSFQSCNLFR